MSLRRNLFLLVSVSTLAVWLTVSWFVYDRVLHEVNEIFDAQLAQYSRLLMAMVKERADPENLDELQNSIPASPFIKVPKIHSLVDKHIKAPGKYERVIGFQLVDPHGRVMLRSEGAPEIPLSQDEGPVFSTSLIGATQWRVFSYQEAEYPLVLHVGEQYDIRREMSGYVIGSMLLPVLVGIPIVGLLIWLSLSRGLLPLVALAREVHKREPKEQTPFDLRAVPSEISPLVKSLNHLLKRLQQALDKERQFTGDAAHELRTPLAALRVQSQVALKAHDDDQRNKALQQILSGVDRMSRLVGQLLTLSRLDWQQTAGGVDKIWLTGAANEVNAELHSIAGDKQIRVEVAGDEKAYVTGDRVLVYVLIRNLLDNAIRYSSAGAEVEVTVRVEEHQAILTVADDGPGIPPEELEAVFNRFHRRPGSRARGAGLGLSIVKKICDLHDAEIDLAASPSGGLKIEIRFPIRSNYAG